MHHPLHTPICDRLGIEYPVFLAGMGGVSLHKLVAAVSNAGGLGIMGAATLGPAELREEIEKTRDLTDKPFAVDLLAPLPDRIRPQMEVLFEEDVRIFVAGLAVPAEFIAEMHKRDMIVDGDVRQDPPRPKSEEAGADFVAAQGTEAGGHTGEVGGMAFVPQAVDAVKIPVIAAGGLADGRGLVAALALGAQGAIFGTRFIASPEAQAAPGYRDSIVRATRRRHDAHPLLHRQARPHDRNRTTRRVGAEGRRDPALPDAGRHLDREPRDGLHGRRRHLRRQRTPSSPPARAPASSTRSSPPARSSATSSPKPSR